MWKLLLFLPVLTIILRNVAAELHEVPPKVQLADGGIVVGSHMSTVNGRPIRAFRGIPYAEPPVGEFRFKSPVPIKPWVGEKRTDQDGNECLAQNIFFRNLSNIGDEDCLTLNVYTPEVEKDKQLYPVMVNFYGGGWIVGSCNSQVYKPNGLLDHDIVYVCGNYRLGAFGFLSTYTEDCPGNFGLKDQNLILKWIQKNIEKFGGDPNNVTIYGESAGAASVGYHMYSPQSKGLFHKAIMQSGSNFDPWTLGDKKHVFETTSKTLLLLNCPVNKGNWTISLNCLRTKSGYEILSTYKDLLKYDLEPSMLFLPVIEPEHEEAFITKNPRDIDIPPSVNVPVIIGMTSDDGCMKSAPIISLIRNDFAKRFYEVLPIFLYYDSKTRDTQNKITNRIDEFYFQGKRDWSPSNHQNLTDLMSDGYFTDGQDQFLRRRFAAAAKTTVGPTYYYIFDHRGPRSLSRLFGGGPHYYGVCHGDELKYLYSSNFPKAGGDDYDDEIHKAMLAMWTNFAKTGNPTPEGSHLPKWIPTNKFPLNYAHIGRQNRKNWRVLTNEVGLWEDRVHFWRSLENNN